jgi:biotin carboxyl carrier protein
LDFLQEEGDQSFLIIDGMAYIISKSESTSTTIKELKAPISGQIIDVSVTAGKEVKRGELLIILEAMKMENQIKSHLKGRIKEVKVKKGQSVKSGDVILTFE